MTPDFQIVKQRLQLRLITADEAKELVQCIRQSQTLHQWVDWCHALFSHQEAEQFIQATRLNSLKPKLMDLGYLNDKRKP